MLPVLRALNRKLCSESFLAKFGVRLLIRSQIVSEEQGAFRITEYNFARPLLMARYTMFLGTIIFVSYDSIALRVEHFCELILFGLGLPLSDKALQLSSLEDVPYHEVCAEVHLL